jgi:hypothetical protein
MAKTAPFGPQITRMAVEDIAPGQAHAFVRCVETHERLGFPKELALVGGP